MRAAPIIWILMFSNLVYVCAEACVRKDVVFLVDKSISVSSTDFDKAIKFIHDVATFLNIGQQNITFSVVLFDGKPVIAFDFNDHQNKNSLLNALTNIHLGGRSRGSTNITAALNFASTLFNPQNGSRTAAHKAVVLITDGDFDDLVSANHSAHRLHNAHVDLYGVGIGNFTTSSELYRIHFIKQIFTTSAYQYLCNQVPPIVSAIDPCARGNKSKDCPTTSSPTNQQPQKDGDNVGVIAGVSTAFGLITSLLMIFLLIRKFKKKRETEPLTSMSKDVIPGLPPQKTSIAFG